MTVEMYRDAHRNIYGFFFVGKKPHGIALSTLLIPSNERYRFSVCVCFYFIFESVIKVKKNGVDFPIASRRLAVVVVVVASPCVHGTLGT